MDETIPTFDNLELDGMTIIMAVGGQVNFADL